jgi:hypothetical protein
MAAAADRPRFATAACVFSFHRPRLLRHAQYFTGNNFFALYFFRPSLKKPQHLVVGALFKAGWAQLRAALWR